MKNLIIDNQEFKLVGKNEYKGKLNVWDKETAVFIATNLKEEVIKSIVQDKID